MGMPSASAMSVYKWKKRPLLVFAGSDTSKSLAEQRRIIANSRGELADRDVVVVWIVGSNATAELGKAPTLTAAGLRARYGIGAHEFRALLVGKDGTVKLSSTKALEGSALVSTIDAMPMRRDEMRRK